MKRSAIFLLFISSLVTGCQKDNTIISAKTEEVFVAVNQNAPIENIRDIPIEAVFFNECCDEEVYLTGNAHFVITKNIIHITVSGITGTGLSTGYSYVTTGSLVQTNIFYSNQFEGTLTFKLNMQNTEGCSFRLKALFHSNMNANGELVVSFENFQTKCNP
ncbi:MAG TPA: hypothetical protein VF476_07045 [Chitinophagaceae bacterium]